MEKPVLMQTAPDVVVKERKRAKPRRAAVTPEMVEHVAKLSGLGLTREQIRNYYGMGEEAWSARIRDYPNLDAAMKKGRAEKLEKVTGKLWEKIEQGNLSAIIFYLKTQGLWREKDYNENGEGGTAIKTPALTLTVHDPIEASKIYQQIMLGS